MEYKVLGLTVLGTSTFRVKATYNAVTIHNDSVVSI